MFCRARPFVSAWGKSASAPPLQKLDGRRSAGDVRDIQGSTSLSQSRYNDQHFYAGERLLSRRIRQADERDDQRQGVLRQPRKLVAVCADRFFATTNPTRQIVFPNSPAI